MKEIYIYIYVYNLLISRNNMKQLPILITHVYQL